MPGPEQPDKTSDKSSTPASKLEKSAGERLSQDAFSGPPKDTGTDFGKGTAQGDKSDPGTTKGGETTKFPQDGGSKDTKIPDTGFDQKPSTPESAPPPEKQPQKQPPVDGSSQFDKPPPKPPPSDGSSQQFADKPPPPAQSGDVGMPQKEPTDAGKKVPVGDGQSFPSKPPVERSAQSDAGLNAANKPPVVEPRSAHSDSGTRPGTDAPGSPGKPPVDQTMAARNASQDLPEKLPQKQPPSHDAQRPTSVEPKPEAPAPREERRAPGPAGSEANRGQDAPRVTPRSGPDADNSPRASERPRVDQERRAESPAARPADAQAARGADRDAQAGADRARSQSAPGEAGQLNRANLNPRDHAEANRLSAPADAASSRRGEAAVAEGLRRSPNAGGEQRQKETVEADAGRPRRPQGAGAQGGDETRVDQAARSSVGRGSFEKSSAGGEGRSTGDISRLTARDAQAAGSRSEVHLKGSVTVDAADGRGRQLHAERAQPPADRVQPVERPTALRPEMKALADLVGKRAEQQDVSAVKGARAEIPQARTPQSAEAPAGKPSAIQGSGERTAADAGRRIDDRSPAQPSAADKTGTAGKPPVDAAARVVDPAAGVRGDATTPGARSAENVAGARQPGRAPAEGPAQPGARQPVDAGAGIRPPDRAPSDTQGQGRQPVSAPADSGPGRQPATAIGDGKGTGLPPQRAGVDAVGDGRTVVQGDAAGRLPSTRVDGTDRTPVKPGSMLEPLKPGDKRELTGAEIAIAAIVAAAGASRVRPEDVRIQRGQQPVDKDPLAAIQDAVTPQNPAGVPAGFLPEFHVEGDAIALRGTTGGDDTEKRVVVEAEAAQDQAAAAAAAAPVFLRPTCLVSESDTLISIAEELFHDPNLGWLIADLNRDRIQERFEDGKRIVEIASRQELFVPVWQDIVEFYERRSESAKPENLVTIVSQSQLDRELLNATLAKVVGAAQASPLGSAAAKGTTGELSPLPVQAPAKPLADWKTLAAGLPKATAAALLAFSNRWPKPPAAPASEDIVSNITT